MAAVLLFHAEVAGTGGGFLGVSLFFTLSGYLITRLLLREHATRDRISLRSFWQRRIRRLAPVALLTIAAVVATARWWLDAVQQRHLRGDALASVADVANWHFAAAGRSYADLFAAPSPLQHLWSLAIEEQFYVVLPLIVVLTMRGGLRRLGTVAAVLFAASTVAALAADDTVAYYGTHTRASELLAGVLLAVVLTRRPLTTWPQAAQRTAAAGGVAAVGAFVALVVTSSTGSTWLDHGGFTAVSLIWVALIVGASVPGPIRWALSLGPLVAVGAVSYGLYVFHWPLFLFLSPERTGVDGPALVGLRLAVTGAVAAASYRWLERPIRYPATPRPRPRVVPTFAATVAAIAVAALVLPLPGAAVKTVADVPSAPVRFAAAAVTPAPPLRVAVVGSDLSIEWRLVAAAATDKRNVTILDATDGECPVFRDVPSPCDDRPDPAARLAALGPVDVVVFTVGAADRVVLASVQARGFDVARWRQVDISARPRVDAVLHGAVPVVVADAQPGGDMVAQSVSQEMLASPGVTALDTTAADSDLLHTVITRAKHRADPRIRVLVIGDSTSYSVARQLDALAGNHFDVLWAGRDNCPLVPEYESRWWGAVTARTDDCPSVDHGWPELVAEFRPAVVLAVDSLPELSEQRYSPNDSWHVPGDQVWEEHNRPAADAITAMLAPYGAKLLIADAPPITHGSFAGSPMAHPSRLAAWNDLVAAWTAQSPTVERLPLADEIVAIEDAAGRSLRPDGVHLDDEGAADVVRDIVLPALLRDTSGTASAEPLTVPIVARQH